MCKVWGQNCLWFLGNFSLFNHSTGIFDMFTRVKIGLFEISFSWGKSSHVEVKYFFPSSLGPILTPPNGLFYESNTLWFAAYTFIRWRSKTYESISAWVVGSFRFGTFEKKFQEHFSLQKGIREESEDRKKKNLWNHQVEEAGLLAFWIICSDTY